MSVYISAELRRQVREHFANRCAYCHTAEELTVAIFEVEHILPRSGRGETVFLNLCLACPTCNRYKSDLTLVTDPTTGMEVRLFHPHQDQWLEHFSWNEDATQISGLTPTGQATIEALKMNRPQMIRVRRMWVALNEHPPDCDSSE
jgi:hypothetical protein